MVTALALAAIAVPARASLGLEPSPFDRYVRARAADAAGMADDAARQYAAVLDANPDDMILAARAYRQAVIAGDAGLALRAAQLLDRQDELPYEGQLLLFSDALARRDWKVGQAALTAIERDKAFAFALPLLRGWMAVAEGRDPVARLQPGSGNKAMAGYVDEHRVLMLLALGRVDAAEAALSAGSGGSPARDARLRLRVAQAREGGVNVTVDPAYGLSELYLRLALDFSREKMSGLAVMLAQFATFANPGHDEARLGAAQLLSLNGRHDAALALIDRIATTADTVAPLRNTRVRILLAKGDPKAALALLEPGMKAATPGTDDFALLGDIRAALNEPAKAAEAYGRAIALLPPGEGERLSDLWLQQGSALEQAGDWPAAKRALERAVALAPDQPVALNYLGFAQLSRRENVAEARKLIERALELRPDDAAITDSLGWALYLQGDVPGAILRLEAAALGDPGGSEINEHLGDAYWSAGRRVEARYAWSAALVKADAPSKARLERKIDLGLEAGE